MMASELYDLTKHHLKVSVNPWQAYCRMRLTMMAHLMVKVETITWRWR